MDGVKLEEATLANIANGALAAQFPQALSEIATVFAEATSAMECPWEAPKNVVTVKVEVEVEIAYSMETHTISVAARTGVKKPKRRWSASGIFLRNRKWQVTKDGEQLPMFGAELTPLRGGKDDSGNGE